MDEAGRKESTERTGGGRKSLSPNKDDSLTDFKSPRLEQAAPIKIKVANDKKGKKSSSKNKTSGNKKKETVGKEVAQLSIESSFFKAANNGKKDGHTCPLCMKFFADTSAGSSHTKSCAARNNVSTKKLLAAVALQERQANERVAIGLPAGPIAQPKDKTSRRPREPASKSDPDLQLALALSKSLQENCLEREFEEALLLAGEHRGDGQIVGFSSDSERRKTLKNFGFLTNKPPGASDAPARTRRKKHLGPTILQMRSQEARDRLLTERIAEILMGDEAITQVCQRETTAEVNDVNKQKVILRSRLLREIHRTTQRLWDIARMSASMKNYYVEELSPVIGPAVLRKQETPENPASESTEVEPPIAKDENVKYRAVSHVSSLDEDDRLTEKMSVSSEEYEQINTVPQDGSRSPGLSDIRTTDRHSRNTLSIDWANTLNVSSMSDVVVLVNNGHIWAHRLVFYVRCSDILLDCESNADKKFSHVREKIRWPDVDLSTGLAFLEFVYSGSIEKNNAVFSDDRVASGVRRLARKYRLKVLFDYLREKQTEYDKTDNVEEDTQPRRSELCTPIVIQADDEVETVHENLAADTENECTEKRVSLEFTPNENSDALSSAKTNVPAATPTRDNLRTLETDSISVISVASSRSCASMSPDLFDETTEEAPTETEKNSQQVGENPDLSDNENSNLNALVDLIAEEGFSSYNETNERSSASTVVDTRHSLSQGQIETPKSRGNHAGVARDNDRSLTKPLIEKPKSNLSLLIERVRKINAMEALDSYTEEESLAELVGQKRRRNPFDVNNVSSDKSISDSSEKVKKKRGRRGPEKRGLSVFDEPIELTSPTKTNSGRIEPTDDSSNDRTAPRTEESCVVDDTAITNDEDISMYSKYRKTHRHNNSISNYRNMLKGLANATATSVDGEKGDNLSSLDGVAIDLTRESDTDGDVPPSPMSGASNSYQRKNFGDDSDNDSVRSALTTVVQLNNRNDLSDDDGPKDKNKENVHRSSVNTTPESVKSSGNSPPYFHHSLLDDDDGVFAESWKSKMAPSPSTSAVSGDNAGSKRARKSRETKYDGIDDSFERDGKSAGFCANEKSSKGAKSLRISPEYSSLDVFEIDEEMFSGSLRKSKVSRRKSCTPSPKRSFDCSDKSASSRREMTEEGRAKNTSRVDDFGSKNPGDTSYEYPDFDVDDLITKSLKNTYEMPYRSPTPDDNFSPEKTTSSSGRRISSSGDKRGTPQKFVDDLEDNKSNKSSECSRSPRNCSEYHYEVFEPDDRVFTQSFNSSPSKQSNHRSTLKIPSPIVISSSPEFNPDIEVNYPDNECNKENLSSSDRGGPLSPRKSLEIHTGAISPTNLETWTRFSRSSLDNFAERVRPSSSARPTTPQPGTSRKYSPGVPGESSGYAKSPLVRWKSMPSTGSSKGQIGRKRSRTPQRESSRLVVSQNVTPPVNYDTMDTPELKKELAKYGMKPQSRNRARKLLNHIYNELHPVVPLSALAKNSEGHLASSDNEEPPVKKIAKPCDEISEDSDTDREMPSSRESVTSAASVIPEEIYYSDGNASPNDSGDSTDTNCIKKAFNALLKEDKELHNKVLTYEPLPLDLLSLMLKCRGLKCQLTNLKDFLDGECIAFQVPTSRTGSNKTRGKKNARGGKKKVISQKS